MSRADVVVVGAGFYGLTIARRAADDGLRVTVIERRPHLGGNAWSYVDRETGVDVHAYGSHIFHTSNERVWAFVNRFCNFNDYRHHVWTVHAGRIYPMPISLATISLFVGRSLSPSEARKWVSDEVARETHLEPSDNLEDKAISLIGRQLYEAFIRGYTAKQWQTDPRNLPSEIITRLPVRYGFDTRYFSDRYEGIPVGGYGPIFDRMVEHPNISTFLNIDWFDVKRYVSDRAVVVYTGPVDRYYNYRCGRLSWRTLDLELESLEMDDYQGTAVVNFADQSVPFTRVHEFSHFQSTRDREGTGTLIMREYSRFASRDDEPYYPVGTARDREVLAAYRSLVAKETGVHFGGRLGTYQYLDMHMAIAAALTAYENEIIRSVAVERAGAI